MTTTAIADPQRYWYHLTRRERLPSITREGLRGDAPRLLSGEHTPDWIASIYGVRPMFVSKAPWVARRHLGALSEYGQPADFAMLEVDAAGLRLLPDVMTLGDKGAYLEDADLWFEEDSHPLRPWLKNGSIFYRDLFSDVLLARAAIDWTGTAAVLESIDASRLRTMADW